MKVLQWRWLNFIILNKFITNSMDIRALSTLLPQRKLLVLSVTLPSVCSWCFKIEGTMYYFLTYNNILVWLPVYLMVLNVCCSKAVGTELVLIYVYCMNNLIPHLVGSRLRTRYLTFLTYKGMTYSILQQFTLGQYNKYQFIFAFAACLCTILPLRS